MGFANGSELETIPNESCLYVIMGRQFDHEQVTSIFTKASGFIFLSYENRQTDFSLRTEMVKPGFCVIGIHYYENLTRLADLIPIMRLFNTRKASLYIITEAENESQLRDAFKSPHFLFDTYLILRPTNTVLDITTRLRGTRLNPTYVAFWPFLYKTGANKTQLDGPDVWIMKIVEQKLGFELGNYAPNFFIDNSVRGNKTSYGAVHYVATEQNDFGTIQATITKGMIYHLLSTF